MQLVLTTRENVTRIVVKLEETKIVVKIEIQKIVALSVTKARIVAIV